MALERVALVVSGFEGGGVERNFTHLALGLDRAGIETILMVGNPEHAFVRDLLDTEIHVLPVRGERTIAIRHLVEAWRPDVLMTGKLADDYAAINARRRLGSSARCTTQLVAAVGTLLSGRFEAHPWNPFKRVRDIARIRSQYRKLDGIAAISSGVAADLERVFGVRGVPIEVLPNPIIPPSLGARAAAPCPHPWLATTPVGYPSDYRPAVIIAVGGLRQVKGFETLIRAFAMLPDGETRLLILGEGKERSTLSRLARQLGVANRVDLPGFVADPYPYIARTRLLVLSSSREGLGNVVIEALALATPVVATDCSHGLRAVNRSGALGSLVPPSDPHALSLAIGEAMRRTIAPALLMGAATPFHVDAATRAHVDFFRSLAATPAR